MLGIGLIAISAGFFGLAASFYQAYLDARFESVDESFERCLSCGLFAEAARGNLNWSLLLGGIFLATGASVLAYAMYLRSHPKMALT